MLNYGVSDFVGILITIGLYFYLTNLLWWGFAQIMERFFEEEEEEHKNFFHHHFHYKAK